VAAFLAVPALAPAQESYTIKIKKSAKGSWTREQKTEDNLESTKVSDNNGKTLDEKKKTTKLVSVYDQTVLERPDPKKKATALKRTYEKAVVTTEEGTKDLPYQGKTVIIEKKDGKYHFKYENGGEITGDAAKWLDKEFNREKEESDIDYEELMLPKMAVKTGETWKIPMDELVKAFEKDSKMTTHADKCTGTGTLVKAYKKDGRQWGDMQFKVQMPLKSAKEGNTDIALQPGSVVVLEANVSACIDGSVEDGKALVTWQLTGTALVPADNPMARVELQFRSTSDSTTTEVLKK
jgi:hypothetical protein